MTKEDRRKRMWETEAKRSLWYRLGQRMKRLTDLKNPLRLYPIAGAEMADEKMPQPLWDRAGGLSREGLKAPLLYENLAKLPLKKMTTESAKNRIAMAEKLGRDQGLTWKREPYEKRKEMTNESAVRKILVGTNNLDIARGKRGEMLPKNRIPTQIKRAVYFPEEMGKRWTTPAFGDIRWQLAADYNRAETFGMLGWRENVENPSEKTILEKEKLESLRWGAEKEGVNPFSTAEVHVDMSGMQNHVDSDVGIDGILDALSEQVARSLAMCAEGVHF